MSIIQDKLGNEFLRSGGMEPNFPPGMIMFSHLPPVTSFTRIAAQNVMPSVSQEMILKKEPTSPPDRTPHELMHPMVGIKQERLSDYEQYRLYGGGEKLPGTVEVNVGSQSSLVQDLSLRDFSARTDKGFDPKQGVSGKKKRPNAESQEIKTKRKRSDYSKSSVLDGDGNFSPNQKPHICEHCSAAFRSSYHLRRHVLIHTGERPFQCSQCNMSFIQKYLLQRHEKIHSGEKPFCCDQCNMRFIQKYHMERHKRTHSGEKPYKCNTCQQYFSRTDRLLKHKRTCGEAIRKGGTDSEPGPSNRSSMSHLEGNFDLTQGNTSASGRKKSKSKTTGNDGRERKKVTKINAEMPSNLNLQDYAVEIPMVSTSNNLVGATAEELQARAPKLVFKKVNRKPTEKTDINLVSPTPINMVGQKLLAGKQGTLDLTGNTGMENMSLLQSAGSKAGQTSSNYDDAMQFLKKRRYLQAASSNSDYAVNVGHMAAQQSVIQAAVASVMENDTPLPLLDSSSLNVEIKPCHDKSGIPDEVLQSLLDHYTHKSESQHEVPFEIPEQHVDIHPSAENPEIVQEEGVCANSQTSTNDKAGMLHEYSKYLQQALERTSQNNVFPLGPGLQFGSLASSLSSHALFSDKQAFTTSPLECGFNPSVTSVLPTTLPKSHFGMLVGSSQPGFPLPTIETTHQQLTPSQELADQIDQQKNLDSSSFQINSQDLATQKEQPKTLESPSNFQIPSQELPGQIDTQKNMEPRAIYQIENFAQAFGSQFKSGGRVAMAFNTSSNGEVDHRIRTPVSEFSGYTNLLSDVSEPVSTRAKTPTSQSYR
ncbi:zinc finger protein 281 isoform X1 [Latimeria chalumnae]|uniref:Zinc finger protein 281 n=1 Tax=Latimeria chalumnae TaxID=7897 RepID=H3B3R6_LATCH|nr:PREDICTED: zinc finger protein 281 isoform X1 [Latimeria chalumnae]XP_006000839.1 PREDICTED: zinc finger protein 281 isoform X1 [Latimeria chalumnae]|eukprot:XP_006000838.1 PREDICTED: zinc finger protein 281 isoform X1 [Latimeria chalumnae]